MVDGTRHFADLPRLTDLAFALGTVIPATGVLHLVRYVAPRDDYSEELYVETLPIIAWVQSAGLTRMYAPVTPEGPAHHHDHDPDVMAFVETPAGKFKDTSDFYGPFDTLDQVKEMMLREGRARRERAVNAA